MGVRGVQICPGEPPKGGTDSSRRDCYIMCRCEAGVLQAGPRKIGEGPPAQLQALALMGSPCHGVLVHSPRGGILGKHLGASWESKVPAGDRVLWGEGSLRKAAASSTNVGVPAASCGSANGAELIK